MTCDSRQLDSFEKIKRDLDVSFQTSDDLKEDPIDVYGRKKFNSKKKKIIIVDSSDPKLTLLVRNGVNIFASQ